MNTHDQIPLQTILSWVDDGPNGRDYAPPGYVEIDRLTGNWWLKTTAREYNTGWVLIGGSPGPPPSFVIFTPDTVADLKAIPSAPTNRRALLGGKDVIGDGYGSSYYWSAADTRDDTDINGNQLLNVVRPNDVPIGSPGRWVQYTA